MITSLSLQNFKAHQSTTIELGRLTVLVGPNGAGKTSVLQALECLSELLDYPASNVFLNVNEPAVLERRGSNGQIFVRAEGTLDKASPQQDTWKASYEIKLGLPDATGGRLWDARCIWTAPDGQERSSGPDLSSKIGGTLSLPYLRSLRSVGVFRFDPKVVASPSYSDQEEPRVGFNGSNTASVLAAIKLSDDERFDAIVNGLRKLVPSVKRVRIRPARTFTGTGAQTHEVMGHQMLFDFKGAPDVPASAVSEGTLISLALLTVLHSDNRPDLILIDDIEQALHPTAQIALMKQLAGILESFPDVQIIATTHSPFILDGVTPEQVLVFFRRENGYIVAKRLSEHPDAQRAKGTLSAGQIWTLDPEDWVAAEGPPA